MRISDVNVMIDIETLGVRPNSAILSVGAVVFGPTIGITEEQVYVPGLLQNSLSAGLRIDASTFEWWMSQPDEARAGLFTDPPNDFLTAMRQLEELMTVRVERFQCKRGQIGVWANSPSFDCVMLRELCHWMDWNPPWAYRQEWDFRTLRNLYPSVSPPESTVSHNALADALWQAEYVLKIVEHCAATT